VSRLLLYFRSLSSSKIILWCYATWYCAIVSMYFDPSPRIWLTALVVSFVIGIALNLSVARGAGVSVDRWQTIRLFLMPFCVSSYSSLIKDKGFIVIFPKSRTGSGRGKLPGISGCRVDAEEDRSCNQPR
jgi:hypothetical protein